MEPFFYPSFYPSRFYHSEPQFSPNHWMPNMNPWYGGQPFDHSPYGHRRPFRYPVATRGDGRNSRVWSNLFAQPPQRSRVASVRSPLLQLFGDDFFRSALADDIICLLEHHSQNPDEATTKTPEGRLITGEKKDSSTASKASSPDPTTQPSTSSTEPSKESSSSSNIKSTKEDTDSEKKESSDPCEGYMLRFELSPDGFYRPVYSPVPLTTPRRKQLLNDDFFKSVFTDDLVSLLEHHVKEADDAYRREAGLNETDTSSSKGAIAEKEADDEPIGKPFNVSLKLGDFNPENVNVSLDGRKVIVKAKQEEQGKDDSWKRHSHVEYSFLLPEETPAESLTSSFDKDGILSITAKTQDDETTNNLKAVKCSSEENVETAEQKTEETN
ncbi:uncharacterized protein LOC121411741 [Lytechinus variegatus]|uniref:uncharacterized protein LOC121411741 n=1 Tax=Lytechinus variegatus TaxID=7654 RepID=UPI001BB1DA2C|nr:uncharacterized protein LOC121411741 [Lytechinus variegatus]